MVVGKLLVNPPSVLGKPTGGCWSSPLPLRWWDGRQWSRGGVPAAEVFFRM